MQPEPVPSEIEQVAKKKEKKNSKNSMTDFLTAHIMPTNTLI